LWLPARLPIITMLQAGIIQSQVAESKTKAITDAVKAYSRRLMGFIRKRVPNEEDAEDILQDVFYQLVGNAEPIDLVSAWLFRVARNKIIDRSRKKQLLPLDELLSDDDEDYTGDWMDIIMDDQSNPETIYLRTLFQETLAEALSELPEEQRQAFVLNEIDGISFKQISTDTGIAVNTLISRKRYAVLHLRERLAVLHHALNNY
jgi:RNA polymerase sigma factor (sigma-70 family)